MTRIRIITPLIVLGVFAAVAALLVLGPGHKHPARAQATPTPTPAPAFDQGAAIAAIRESIKGREQEPAEKVFTNMQLPHLKQVPAARLLAMMEIGYARSLGVDCTHCHVAGKWASDEKPQKQIAREMALMMRSINSEMLANIKGIRSAQPTINCTTCHRGELKPAQNLSR